MNVTAVHHVNRGLVALIAAAGIACVSGLESGQLGNVRYFGELLGEPPMRLVPPLADRDGNIYVLYGAPDRQDTQVFVGRRGGGWTGGCVAHRGVYGLHGFIGRTLDRVWYWSGTALVEVSGDTGACRLVLRNDPVSGTELQFLAVAPYVDETPSRRFAYALVRGITGDPQFTMVDLDRRLPFNARPFPVDTNDVDVIATGAWNSFRLTAFVIRAQGDSVVYFLDRLGNIIREVPANIPQTLEEYAAPAFLEFSDDGVGVARLTDGRILVVTGNSAEVEEPGFAAEGVLRWDGQVFVTGRQGDTPVVAVVTTAGGIEEPSPFRAAESAAAAIQQTLAVNDERGQPARPRIWEGAQTAIGDVPLITPWSLDPYTVDSVGWLLAGPGFESGIEPVTATAFVPIGLEVP